jgi:HlyD family secretion protein
MSVFRWIFAILVVGLVGVGALSSLRPRPQAPISVQLAKVTREPITRTVRAAGKLEPLHKVNVSCNITGEMLDLKVGIGSVVKKGQYLGQIDTSRYRAQAQQQRASLEAAQADVAREDANLQRLRNVLKRIDETTGNAFNVGEREQALTNVRLSEAQLAANRGRSDVARASLAEASRALEWATMRAPVDGTVLSVNHRVGERVRGSDFSEDVVLVLGSLSQMDVRIEVGEHDVVHIHPGQKSKIEVDALPDLTLEGEVIDSGRDAIIKNPGTDNEVTSFPVWVSIDKPPATVLSGMSAQVTISTDSRPSSLVVPIQAVTVRPKEEPSGGAAAGPSATSGHDKLEKVVFVAKNGTAERRKVSVGIASETHMEIVDGLAEGEEVVEGPYRVLARELKPGARLEPMKPPGGSAAPGGDKPASEKQVRR